jgi:iron(III) transport system substrate-binding protein
MKFKKLSLFAVALSSLFIGCNSEKEKFLTIYSSRNEQLIKPVFDLYTQETGVKINFTTGKAGALTEKIKAEGKRTPADLLITVDGGNLWNAKEKGILAPIKSEKLSKAIPAHLKDSEDYWFGVSLRARTMVYHPDRIKEGELTTYEALADSTFKGRLVLRTSKKVYNQSLVSMLIDQNGEEKTKEVVSGWVNNLAIEPTSNDTKAMQALIDGKGDVTLVNTYYYGRMQAKDSNLALKIFWPNQVAQVAQNTQSSDSTSNSGVHINVSGIALIAASKNQKEATAFVEWLITPKAQALFAELNMEYPVINGVKLAKQVEAWGTFKKSETSIANYGENQAKAIRLMQSVNYK